MSKGCHPKGDVTRNPRICYPNENRLDNPGCGSASREIAGGSHTYCCLVASFEQNYRGVRGQTELREFREGGPTEEVLDRAGRARWKCGCKFNHQFRINNSALEDAAKKLVQFCVLEKIQDTKCFECLIELIHNTIGRIPGIGELMVYDTALRIGACKKMYPEKVYLHNGTREGAKALGVYGQRRVRVLESHCEPESLEIHYELESLEIEDFPDPINKLQAYEIEDFLCIYKDKLKEIKNAT